MNSLLNKLTLSRERVQPIYSGTMDILVSEQNDGTLKSTPFHVRVGNLKKLSARTTTYFNKFRLEGKLIPQQFAFSTVLLQINNKTTDVPMYLNLIDGVGYFKIMNNNEINLTRTPTQEMLTNFNLNYGENKIQYFFESGESMDVLDGKIYKLNQGCKIIISDIDGTITKSDVMGMVMTFMGKNYSHEDICELFYKLFERGYFILYVSARSILQYDITRKYIERQLQGVYKLPDGPIILSDEAVYEAFKTEVIYKTSDVLKSRILKQIGSLFEKPDNLYAGIGNRENDVVAYRVVGIPFSRIFLIDRKSVIYKMDEPHPISYKIMNANIDKYFEAIIQ